MSHHEKERLAAIFCSDAAVGFVFSEPLRSMGAAVSQFVIGSREEPCGTASSAGRNGGGRLPPDAVGAGHDSVIGCFRRLHRSREGGEVLVVDFSPAPAWAESRGSRSEARDRADAYFFDAIRTFFGVTRIVCGRAGRRQKGLLVATLAEGAKADRAEQAAAGARLFLLEKAVRAGHGLADGKLDVFGLVSYQDEAGGPSSPEDSGTAETKARDLADEEAVFRFREALAFLTSGSTHAPPSGSMLFLGGQTRCRSSGPSGFGLHTGPGITPLRVHTNGRSNGRRAGSC